MMPIRPVTQITTDGGTADPNYPYPHLNPGNIKVAEQNYSLAGDCFKTELVIDEQTLMEYIISEEELKESIKKQLCAKLVDELTKSKYVEFTCEENRSTNKKIFRARIFATPDAQVRMLRQIKAIK